jgi:hypothetical protein
MRAMLGLEADPETGTLRVTPAFPDWLSRVRIDGLDALGRRFDLEVVRDGVGYRVQSDGQVVEARSREIRRQDGKENRSRQSSVVREKADR